MVPDGMSGDPDDGAAAFDGRIAALGGVDVQILGIGGNGHLAFNEPGSSFDSPTRVITLADQTRSDNARHFGGRISDVPRRAITQGLATIGRARSIVLLVKGSAKATSLKAALRGTPALTTPASMLQLHGDVTVVTDDRRLRYSSIDTSRPSIASRTPAGPSRSRNALPVYPQHGVTLYSDVNVRASFARWKQM